MIEFSQLKKNSLLLKSGILMKVKITIYTIIYVQDILYIVHSCEGCWTTTTTGSCASYCRGRGDGPELIQHDSPQGARDLGKLAELVQVAPRLYQHHFHWHALCKGVEMNGQLADVHLVVYHMLSIDGHDGHTNEQMKGVGGVVCPAGLPDAECGLVAKLPPETNQ